MKSLLLSNPDYTTLLLHGLGLTVQLFCVSWIAAMMLACLLASLRLSPVRWVQMVVGLFVAYHRNVPGLVQIFVWYFGVPQLLPMPWQDWLNRHNGEFILSCIALSLYAAAYMSEDIRSGFRSISPGQTQAARALGLSGYQTMLYVLLPQALRMTVAPLVNQSLSLFKATSLAMTIGVAELMHAARRIENETYRTFDAFLIVSICYLAGSWLLMGIGWWVTRRQAIKAAS
ncbi:amino acid ABC transporter permease [Orrella sp. NBD-18]|uniref:Amino acid ABC transporter permease n=1 Tax=Sheuella amnicola TaxID=2707330 RepID=A0A6B2R1J2_9BURK|nr:amino acid ABC transporter permease [Sheuella amnicola]NDY84112.1 amino acid ABC transporter permease [Sheuella amnicola]HBI84159.1 ABC transporter permease [Alcaligenaceae bacterium]